MAKKMTKKELASVVAEYKSLKELLRETEAELEKLEARLKDELAREGVSELMVGDSTVRYTEFTTRRFDQKGFKAFDPETFEKWMKETKGHRFSVA